MKPFQWIALCLVSLICSFWLGSCSSPPPQAIALNLDAASLTRRAVEELNELYQQEHPHIVLYSVFASSDVVRDAIEQGDPFDGVLFADAPPLDRLQAKGLTLPESRQELATTDLVVIAPVSSSVQLSDIRELASDRIKTVAIGNRGLAVGRYAWDLLARLGIEETVESKAVLATAKVPEILRAIERGEAEVGITYLPEALNSPNVKVLATAPKDLYETIRVGAAIVKTSTHPREMQTYLDFLSSDRALKIFQQFGFHPPNRR
ncbi:MAG: molybdate ABC transporter substrate-binding protein [Cyanobacteriota bacterium]|nr:molybdate ABC transporter substrate-binding protein [Cyanobacteriota bacterium]